MRLIINAIPLLGEESGIGNYTRHLAVAMMRQPEKFDVTFFYGYTSKKLIANTPAQNTSLLAQLKGLARKSNLVRRTAKKAFSLVNMVRKTIFSQEWDCYFEPNFVLLPHLSAPVRIMTLHDFSCFRCPQWHPVDRVAHMEKFLWPSVENATHIITGSESVRTEAIRDFGISPERITAIPHGVDTELFHPFPPADVMALREKYRLPEHFILHVGAIEPRKNLNNLIAAHTRLPMPLREKFPLLLIGPKGWNNGDIMKSIDDAAPYVRLIGHVPLAELPRFYSACDIFAYPSWYEGFGLPVLEAMACEKPILASNAAALVELCNGAAMHVAPGNIDEMATTLKELMLNKEQREHLGAAAKSRAKDFNWEKAAQSHMHIFTDKTC